MGSQVITKKAAIVIHIYKDNLSEYEKISLLQLKYVLGSYPIYLTKPLKLDIRQYKEVLGTQLEGTISYNQKYFNGLKGYNYLLLSKEYYKSFLEFDYILLYHTDAFVFKDELNYWIEKGYDNIGAPIYHYDGTLNPKDYICSGNGGFCLRKVETFYEYADSYKWYYRYEDTIEDFLKYNWRGKIARSFYYLGLLSTITARLHSNVNTVRLNEDVIWGHYIPKYYPAFKNAPFEDGMRFSMEYNCDKLLLQNNNELPFGCHGWFKEKFIDFWKPYVENFGYQYDI
ncbi:DUF5672 family protein [Chryseosolibacter indicus]|uniref:DUF5672 domain-containing protein n=1 Tax=Chryseosolibacter indicus TaxID=2782351 RepID=A0ABS5VTZ6_9BACT|nr:DUF5672 family protein [Chryseosolibacter indicus]MBT1704893.1 hypothetical protein [Chryseosolibacter indicus]